MPALYKMTKEQKAAKNKEAVFSLCDAVILTSRGQVGYTFTDGFLDMVRAYDFNDKPRIVVELDLLAVRRHLKLQPPGSQ